MDIWMNFFFKKGGTVKKPKLLYFFSMEKNICPSSQVEVSHPAMKTSILLMLLWGLSCALPVSIRIGIHEKNLLYLKLYNFPWL